MSFAVATENLTKRYGDRTVVEGLDLRVPTGCVYGFLGPNGAGKSTTMKMLLSLVRPTTGTVHVLGREMDRRGRRSLLESIGSLIEAPPGYAHLTGGENMRLVQRLLDLDRGAVDDAVRTVRLREQMDKRVRDYSLGMKQRLGIAMALARRPRLLILDEPTNGLDPAGIDEIRVLLRRLAADGVTVMVSSHLLGEIDRTASVLGILAKGRMLFQGTRDQLFAASTPDVSISCSDPRVAADVLTPVGARSDDLGRVILPGPDAEGTALAVRALVERSISVFEVRREEQNLEDMFMGLTAGGRL